MNNNNVPNNLWYTNNHEWLRLEGTIGYIGITDFAQGELGDIVYIEMPSIEKIIQQEEVFGTIEAVKAVSDLYMPITGTILEVNNLLADKPHLINQSPYQEGWIIKISIPDTNTTKLLDSASYLDLIQQG